LLKASLLIFLCVSGATAQTNNRVTISLAKPGEIKVEADLSTPVSSWSFRNAYAGVLGIAERIQDFRAFDAVVQKAAVGEYRSDRKASRISYTVKLPKPTLADVSHFTWIVEDRGFLMLADLIPLEFDSLSAEFVLPEGWTVQSPFPRNANGQYEVAEPEKAVFCVGRALRKSSTTVDGMPLEVVLSGKWSFKERDALEPATRVMKRYLALTGFRLRDRSIIMIAPLPIGDRKTGWKAETRGSTVVLLINPDAEVRRWKPQFTVIFAHEILHLWVPNSLKLDGDYDWFFEGFTLYTALRTSLELRAIDFKEYLNTLGRVYDSYRANPDTFSLIEESERRWASTGSQVYLKGMLVAFLYDLMIRKETAGQRSLAESYRDLFGGQLTDGADGNEAIISVLGSTTGSRSFIKAYVENSTAVELNQVLPAYGMSVLFTGKGSQLRVGGDLNQDQKHLLRSLGHRD
jgi:predicted metalloprotease with PDZ domain